MWEKRGCEWKEVSEVDKNTIKCDHCELKIRSKVERVGTHLEKCKTREGNIYEPKYMLGRSMTFSSVVSNSSDLLNVLVSKSPISTPTQASKVKHFNQFCYQIRKFKSFAHFSGLDMFLIARN